jgi:hypothetical protein
MKKMKSLLSIMDMVEWSHATVPLMVCAGRSDRAGNAAAAGAGQLAAQQHRYREVQRLPESCRHQHHLLRKARATEFLAY